MFHLTYFPRKLFASRFPLWATLAIALICPRTATAQQTSPQDPGETDPALSKMLNDDFRPQPKAIQAGSPAILLPSPNPVKLPVRTFRESDASYEPDCNDPDAHDLNCLEPTRANILRAHQNGYPYYIGHAEPTTEFFSTRPVSGNNMQWKLLLPATEPSPDQAGTRIANFELYPTFWIGLALCDPNSNPFGTCTAVSDTNNPNTAGAAFLELQFYPPGLNCSTTQWCVRLHINTWQNNTTFQMKNCLEPTTQQYVTTDGTVAGPKLLMNNGDTILVTLHDTTNGIQTDVKDVTTSTTGTMVASSANGFVHNSDQTTCATTGFNFHAMYATASPGQTVPWAGLRPNVSLDFEIGHFELCGDTACMTLPDNHDEGVCSVTTSKTCYKNSDCPTGETCTQTFTTEGCGTTRGIGNCTSSDLDHDGPPYLADWPDGNTAAHPATLILGSPDDKGIGPLTGNNEGFTSIKFATTEATNGAFYPYFTQAGTGASCRFNFGNDIPGTTTNNFGKAAQYGTTINNPCLPGTASDLAITKSAPATVVAGTDLTYTLDITNHGPSNATNLVLTDTLPAGVVLGVITGPNAASCTHVGSTLTCSPGSLANAASLTYTVTVHVPSAGVGSATITNTASITADQLDPDMTNNSDSVTTAVIFRADLSITKTSAPNPAAAGTLLTYTITVHNAGPSDASNVAVSDALPAGVAFASGPCTGTTVLTCHLGTLVNAASKTFTIKVKIPADFLSSRNEATATITNTATVSSSTTDPHPSNNMTSVNTKVIAVADLDLTMTASPNPVHEGGIITYTMTYRNTGPSDTLQAYILDYVPAGLVNYSIPPCVSGVGTVLCNLGPVVPAGFTATFQIQFRVPSNLLHPGEMSRNLTNEARIFTYTVDSDAGDGPALVTTTVVP